MEKLWVKASVIAALVAFSSGVITAHHFNQIYPFLMLGTLAAAFVLLPPMFGLRHRASYLLVLSTLVMISVGLRIVIFEWPVGLIGIDPQVYAVWVDQILSTGFTDGQSVTGFYSVAAAFTTFSAINAHILGKSAATSLAIYSLIIGFSAPVFAAIITHRFTDLSKPYTGALVAAMLATFIAASIRYSFIPIAQTISAVYLAMFVFFLGKYITNRGNRYLGLTTLTMIGLAFSHKTPMIYVVAIAGFTFIIDIIQRSRASGGIQVSKSVFAVGALGAVVLYLQMVITRYFQTAVFHVAIIDEVEPVAIVTPPHAVPTISVDYASLVFNIHIITLFVLAGLAWILIFMFDLNDNSTVILGAASGVVFVTVVGAMTGTAGFNRATSYGGMFLAIVIVAALFRGHPDGRSRQAIYSGLVIGAVAILLVSNLGAPLVAPDSDPKPRDYLTASEHHGIFFADRYIDATVELDHYAYRVGHPHDLAPRDTSATYSQNTTAILHGEEMKGEYVLLRPSEDVYRAQQPAPVRFWRLTWEPTEIYNKEQSLIYNSGGSVIYRGDSGDD